MAPSSATRRDFPWSLALLLGVLLSSLTLGLTSPYCADGPSRGLPLPILRPAHDSTPVAKGEGGASIPRKAPQQQSQGS